MHGKLTRTFDILVTHLADKLKNYYTEIKQTSYLRLGLLMDNSQYILNQKGLFRDRLKNFLFEYSLVIKMAYRDAQGNAYSFDILSLGVGG